MVKWEENAGVQSNSVLGQSHNVLGEEAFA